MDLVSGVGGQYIYQHFVVDCKKRQTVGNKPNIFATFIIQVRLDVVKSTRGRDEEDRRTSLVELCSKYYMEYIGTIKVRSIFHFKKNGMSFISK